MSKNNLKNIENKKVLIIGMGRSGIATAQALLTLGAEIAIQDSKKEDEMDTQLITFFRGKNVKLYLNEIPSDMSHYDMIVISPGVNPEMDYIQDAKNKGVEIIGELEIAYRIGSGNYIAITGTNGKTTTTTLVGEIFERAKKKSFVVGNIGVAVISASINADEDAWMITETSSFQLETTKYFKPVISAILNITPDHLDRHHTMESYGAAKAKIFENQQADGYLIINYDDKECYKLRKGCKAKIVPFSAKEELEFGAFVKDNKIVIKNETGEIITICGADELKIIGIHNLRNALAAAAISYFAGIDAETIGEAIKNFGGVEHRIEYCGEIDSIKFYNDSKGTNVDAALTAIRAIKNNIILIAGGDAKSQSFDEFIKGFNGYVKKLILLGKDANIIAKAADENGFKDYVFAKDMNECVVKAYEMAIPGDTVLLSPACASWDMYDNFEQRGEHFKNCVKGLES